MLNPKQRDAIVLRRLHSQKGPSQYQIDLDVGRHPTPPECLKQKVNKSVPIPGFVKSQNVAIVLKRMPVFDG